MRRSTQRLLSTMPVLLALLAATAPALPARAGGILLDPTTASSTSPILRTPLEIRMSTEIQAQVATTAMDLAFPVTGSAPQRFLIPLPPSASAVGFETWDGSDWVAASLEGKAPLGSPELGSAELNARLAQYLGDNPFVVDLPGPFPGGKVRIRLTYIEVLPYDFGEVRYVAPVSPGPTGPQVADVLEIDVHLATLRDLDSHVEPFYGPVAVQSDTPRDLRIQIRKTAASIAQDFTLSYREKQDGFFFRLLADHESCDEDGFFLLIVEPNEDVSEGEIVPKDFTFIVDKSGSMDGYKVTQAKAAARFAVDNLYPSDRFNVIAYDDQVQALFGGPQSATSENRDSATSFIGWQEAGGSTDIQQAVLKALSGGFDEEHARLILLLTDGQPTAGETDPARIRTAIRAANPDEARIYAFGIGSDVDKEFLTALSTENFAQARFLASDADIEGILEEFFLRINRPVLTDVALDYGGIPVSEVHPRQLTDVFAGSQLMVLGRYSGAGKAAMHLTGHIKGSTRDYPFTAEFPECARDENAFIPRLWAKQKIDGLLAEIARNGQDTKTVDEIVALAEKYGIQTPYTRFGVDPGTPDPGTGTGSGTGSGTGTGSGSGSGSGGSYDWGSSGGLEDGLILAIADVGGASAPALFVGFLAAALGSLFRRRGR